MSALPKTTPSPLTRKRTERPSPEPQDEKQPDSKKTKPLGPSQSFADVLEDMPNNDYKLAGPHLPGSINFTKPLVFQQVDSRSHTGDIALVFGVTEVGEVRVLVHVTNLSTLPNQNRADTTVQKFLRHYQIQAMSWMELPLGQYQAVESSKTLSYNQREVMINHKDIIFHPREGRWNKSIPLRILSFDIETMVRADNQFTPYHQTAEMPVIQIGNVVEHGQRSFRSVFTLDGCTKIAGAQVNSFPNEASMLHAWKQFIIASDPDLITGHNIGRFDFVYLIFRAEVLGLQDFSCLGRLKGLNAKAVKMRSQAEKRPWKDAPVLSGRLQIDTFQYIEERNIRNNFLKRSYTLDAVARDFLKSSKEDLPFQIINSLQEGSDDDRKRLAVYCLKDAHLPLRLLERPGRDADCLPALEEAIAAARAQKFIHIPFSDFLREGRNRTY